MENFTKQMKDIRHEVFVILKLRILNVHKILSMALDSSRLFRSGELKFKSNDDRFLDDGEIMELIINFPIIAFSEYDTVESI